MNYIHLLRVCCFISLSKTIHVNLPTWEGFWDFITRKMIILILIGICKLLQKYFTISFIPFCLNISVLWDRPCDFSKSWWSSCHLQFCMYKTKLIICTPFDPLFKTGPPGITPSVKGSSIFPVTLDRILCVIFTPL